MSWQGQGQSNGTQTCRQLQLPAGSTSAAAALITRRASSIHQPSAAGIPHGPQPDSYRRDNSEQVASAAAAAAQAANIAAINVALKAQHSRDLGMQTSNSLPKPGTGSDDPPAAFFGPSEQRSASLVAVDVPVEVQTDAKDQVCTCQDQTHWFSLPVLVCCGGVLPQQPDEAERDG